MPDLNEEVRMAQRSVLTRMATALVLAAALTGCATSSVPQPATSTPGGAPSVSLSPSAAESSATTPASQAATPVPASTPTSAAPTTTAATTRAPQNPLPPNATQIDPCSYVPLKKVDSLHQVSYVTLSDGAGCVVSAPQRGEFRVTVIRGGAGQTPPADLLAGIAASSFTSLTTAPAVRNGMIASQPAVAAAYGSTTNGSLVVVVGKQPNGQQRLATGTTDILNIVAEGL